MVLRGEQLANLEETRSELIDKALIINTAIDCQVILQLLVEKNIVTRNDVSRMRAVVGNSEKYKASKQWLEQALAELKRAAEDPQWALRQMFNEKLNK